MPELEHRLADVDQRLEDVGDVSAHGLRGSARARNSVWFSTKSTPPWLHGLQRSTRQAASTTPRSTPYRRMRLHGVCRARGMVLAARRKGRGDGALVERGSAPPAASGRRSLRALPGARPALARTLRRASSTACLAPVARELGRRRARDDHEVVGPRAPRRRGPEGLAQHALHPVALHGAAELAADRDPEPRGLARPSAREGVDDQMAAGVGAALAVDPIELPAARQRGGAYARPRLSPAATLGRQPLAALVAPALEQPPAGARLHAARKPWVRARLRFLGW